jgi:endonuclease/exonuclease/phosphatase family metal-dependent hydrolase
VPKTTDGRKSYPNLDDDDTAKWGMRADYVLLSKGLKILNGGICRPTADAAEKVSDHFPMWLDLEVTGNSSHFNSHRRVQTK